MLRSAKLTQDEGRRPWPTKEVSSMKAASRLKAGLTKDAPEFWVFLLLLYIISYHVFMYILYI